MNSLTNGGSGGARRFPEGFVWGVGTSSYQIEGAVDADGRGRSIWDVFSHIPGNVHHGDTGDIACDSYHRVDEDVRLLTGLGVDAYRFAISWPRVLPTGTGPVNQIGLDYYRRLVAQLNEHGIKPVATVYHWDLPQALEDRGGWAVRDTAERLGELAQVLAQALGDQIGMWVTINEPLQSVHQGYRTGTHAPGRRDHKLAAAAIHHVLLGHGKALQALRANLPAGVAVGTTMDPQPFVALDEDAKPVADALDAEHNRVYLDPVLRGAYPTGLRDDMRPPDELIEDGDLALISAPIDFFGLNYYRPHYVRSGDWSDLRQGEVALPEHPGFVEYLAPDVERTVMGWAIAPASLRDMLPLYITENGCAADDYLTPEGVVDDFERIAYIHSHLDAALQAVDDGVNVAGYFHWSLMDNFEWAEGYRRRFGLHYVEFDSGRRIPKRSAQFYRQLTQTGELPALADVLPSAEPVAGVPEAPATV
jgi:beta-glucosidase